LLESTSRLDHVLDLRSATPEDMLKTYRASTALAQGLKEASPPIVREFLLSVLARISVRQDSLELEIHPSRLKSAIVSDAMKGAALSNSRWPTRTPRR